MLQAQLLDKPLLAQVGTIAREIGNTPLLPVGFLSTPDVQVYAKAEWKQLSGSVKARAAYQIIRRAVIRGWLTRDKRLLDASSGNTAIAYAAILKRLDIACTICLPANASTKRITTLEELGVEIRYSSAFEGTEGAQALAREIIAEHPDLYYYADQYSNPANSAAHYHGTAVEIFEQTEGKVTHFVAGLGTTGTFSGTAKRLKATGTTCVALQPDSALHIMEGWKHLPTAEVPAIYEPQWADSTMEIDSDEALEMIRRYAEAEGTRLSPSSAANLVGAEKLAQTIDKGVIVTVLPDDIERYTEIEQEIFAP